MTIFDYKATAYTNALSIWQSDVSETDHYPNVYQDWMLDLFVKQLPDFNIELFRQWLSTADMETIFSPPQFAPRANPKPKKGLVVIEGDFVGKTEKEAPKETDGSSVVNEKDKKKRKRHRPRTNNACLS